MMNETVEILVRTSHGNYGDEAYVVPTSSTVRELKVRIEARHPAHPAADSQRLIFCGRILSDVDAISVMGSPVRETGRGNG